MYINPWVIFFASIFTSNMILANFLGMCSFIAVSKQIKTSINLGLAVTLVLGITTPLNWGVLQILRHFNLESYALIIFIAVIAASVQLLEMVLDRYLVSLYNGLGIFLPLITVNCAILGVSLFMQIRNYDLIQSTLFGLGSGLGWTLAITAMAGLRSRINENSVPAGLRGAGITIITTGLMAMAFIGLSGIVTIQ